MTLLLTMLAFTCAVWIRQYRYHMTHTYAVTYSFGNGCGFVMYSPMYDGLDPILQESVRIHEERHLEQGSYAFWRHNELEVDAYQFQISKLDERIAQFSELNWHKPKAEYAKTLQLLREFREGMLHHLRQYQGLEPPDDEGD